MWQVKKQVVIKKNRFLGILLLQNSFFNGLYMPPNLFIMLNKIKTVFLRLMIKLKMFETNQIKVQELTLKCQPKIFISTHIYQIF